MEDIVLDPAILRWVLLPILTVMFFQGILRTYLGEWMESPKNQAIEDVKRMQLLMRCQRLRANAQFLPPAAVKMRKTYFISKALPEAQQDAQQNPSGNDPTGGDPFAMMNMMKGNMAIVIPNMLMMGWVSYFFSGFVPVKLPFPLTEKFKPMLQRGLSLSSLDPSYVTSLSWYFLVLFGLRGIWAVAMGANAPDDTKIVQQQFGGGPSAPGQDKAFEAERTELEIFQHSFVVGRAEQRLANSGIFSSTAKQKVA